MARDREGDAVASQSKRPVLNSSSDHRAKSSKHVVGGIGSRLHARVPSSKALHKHHTATSTAKLNRADPADTAGAASQSGHRRTTSDLKLSGDAPGSTHIRKNSSHTSLKRNKSHAEVGKKTKSSTNLKRTLSNPAVHKLRTHGSSKVHFNLGDDDDDGNNNFDPDDEDGQEDEWVDASTSASPLLSRRSSTVTGTEQQTVDGRGARPATDDTVDRTNYGSLNSARSLPQTGGRVVSSHNQHLTSRILQRTPSHGAPPKMSADHASGLTDSSRQPSPDPRLGSNGSGLSETPGRGSQARPGSSGQELTSRFVGHNSQEPGSGIAGESFLAAAARKGGISRVGVIDKGGANTPRRPKSTGNLAQATGQTTNIHGFQIAAQAAAQAATDEPLTDDEDTDGGVLSVEPRARRSKGYVVPTDMSRTQQKLNLQRASSTLETAHPHPAMAMGLGGAPVAQGPLVGGSTYDTRDPRLTKLLERTGTEYLVVRRYQNPLGRSIARLAQLPGMDKIRPIPRTGTGTSTRPGTAHSKKGSDLGGGRGNPTFSREHRDSSMATLIGGQGAATMRRPTTPRSTFASSRGMTNQSVSSSFEAEEEGRGTSERQRLSGSSLVNGEDDAGTLAVLRNMWDKNLNLSSSQG